MGFDRVPAELKGGEQNNEILPGCLIKKTAELFFSCCRVTSIIRKDEKEFLRNCLSLSETTY